MHDESETKLLLNSLSKRTNGVNIGMLQFLKLQIHETINGQFFSGIKSGTRYLHSIKFPARRIVRKSETTLMHIALAGNFFKGKFKRHKANSHKFFASAIKLF